MADKQELVWVRSEEMMIEGFECANTHWTTSIGGIHWSIDTRFVAVVAVLRCRLYYRIVHVVDVLLVLTCSEDDDIVFTQTRLCNQSEFEDEN